MVRILLLVLFLCLNILSCSPVYVPNTVNVPLFSNKHEFHLSGYTRSLTNWDVQTAISVANHVGIMANGSYGHPELLRGINDFKHTFGEIGVGLFGTVNPEQPVNVELWAGIGKGKTRSKSTFFDDIIKDLNTNATGSYNRYFVQGSFGVPGGSSGPSLSCRVVKVDFYKFESLLFTTHEKISGYFVEPSLTLKLGPKPFKFVLQGILSQRIKGNKDLAYWRTQIAGGVEVQIAPHK